MPDTTPLLRLNKPLVADAIDEDLWGGYLNDNFDLLDGAVSFTTVSRTSSYTVQTSDYKKLFLCDCTAGDITLTLPAAASAGAGFMIAASKLDSSVNSVIIDANGSQTIDGELTFGLSEQYSSVVLICTGTEWISQSRTRPSQSLTRRTYYTSGSGNFTVPNGVSKVRVTVAGAGGGGHAADGNSGTYAGRGGNSTVTYSATTVTAEGGYGGIWSVTNSNAMPLAVATNGDINIPAGGAAGGNSGINGNNAVKDGENGALAIKEFDVNPADTIAYVVGAGGTKLTAGFVDCTDGASGYIIFEW